MIVIFITLVMIITIITLVINYGKFKLLPNGRALQNLQSKIKRGSLF